MTRATHDIITIARELRPAIESYSEEAERIRHLPDGLVKLLGENGFFDIARPRFCGGLDLDLVTCMRAIEEVSVADATAGWCVGIGGGALGLPLLPPDVAREIYQHGTAVAGVGAPTGRVVPVEGGFLVSGRWGYASGCQHSTWMVLGGAVMDGDKPRMNGPVPEFRMCFTRVADVEIVDTWHVSGLRGTGSNDIVAKGVFVPTEYTIRPFADRPVVDDPRFRIPPFTLGGLLIMPAALGAARRAIDELIDLAQGKTPMLSGSKLRDKPVFQYELARAEAILQGGRAFLFQTAGELWDTAQRGDEITMELRGRVRLSSTYATDCAAQATEIAYRLGGGTSNYESSVLQRCLRDVHAVTQHFVVASTNYETAGRILLGLEPGTFAI